MREIQLSATWTTAAAAAAAAATPRFQLESLVAARCLWKQLTQKLGRPTRQHGLMAVRPFKVVLVGDGACGKTWLISASQAEPLAVNGPARHRRCVARSSFQGEPVDLELHDTPGQDDYDELLAELYRNTDVFLLCFSVDWPDSLTNVFERWQPKIASICPEAPVILVATKMDLRHDPNTLTGLASIQETPISLARGRSAAMALGALAYVECSAKTRRGIASVFEICAQTAVERRRQARRESRYGCAVSSM